MGNWQRALNLSQLPSGLNYLNMQVSFMESNSGTKYPMLIVSLVMMLMTLWRMIKLRPKQQQKVTPRTALCSACDLKKFKMGMAGIIILAALIFQIFEETILSILAHGSVDFDGFF